MAKKIGRVRTFARTASKSMEKHLVENAKKLKENPFLIIPEYDDNISEKHFKKYYKKIEKIQKYFDDEKKLEKLSKKHGFSAALAGTILLAHSEKAPYLAVAELSLGNITYAKRGTADKENLISIQHHDNPVLRLIGFKDFVLKRNLHVYSWDDGFVSTGGNPKPPKEFIDFLSNNSKVFAIKNNDVASCIHLDSKLVRNKNRFDNNYIYIHWKSADFCFAVCEKCAYKQKKNTFFEISKYMLHPNISDDFEINVIGNVVDSDDSISEKTFSKNEYLSGDLKDDEFIIKNMKERKNALCESSEKIFVLDKKSYGANMSEFIKALQPKDYEKDALEYILKKVECAVVFDDATPNSVLERFWEDYGLGYLLEITGDSEVAEKFFKLNDPPSEIIETIFEYKEQQDALNSLPRYDSLPELANFTDQVARAYKTMGIQKAINVAKKHPDNMKAKSIAFAFLTFFGKGKDEKWRFSDVEVELGDFLSQYIKKLLDSSGKDYHEALKKIISSCGSSEKIDNKLL